MAAALLPRLIVRGVDIEHRIFRNVQSARSESEFDSAFDALQDELRAQINKQTLEARERLLERVDEQVMDRQLLCVARADLSDARFRTGAERHFDSPFWPQFDLHACPSGKPPTRAA